MKLVITPNENRDLSGRIAALGLGIDVAHPQNETETHAAIADADAFYGNITPALLAGANRLRWIQSPSISQERFMFPELIAHPAIMTNPRGIFSEDIADHVLAYILVFARQLRRYWLAQRERKWVKESAGYPVDVIHLPDTTIGILGLGGIGQAVGKRAHAHDMRVLAVDARLTEAPPTVERLWGPAGLPHMLAESDWVVICAPETPETHGLFNTQTIGMMKHGSYLINIGRGKIVKLDAVVEALKSGKLAGVGLDVFETEPLPTEHPLWGMENVIITPHTAGAGPHIAARREAVLLDNLRRFVAGQPLENVVDKARWF